MVLYINPANHAPGVKNGPAPGPLYKSCLPCPWGPYRPRPRGVMAKNIKNLLLQNHKAQSFHVLSVAMYSGHLYKSCQLCPWGPYGPRPGGGGGDGSWVKHKKIFFSETTRPCQQCHWGLYRPRPRHVIIYHRLIMEICEKIFSATA